MKRTHRRVLLGILAALTMLTAACGGAEPSANEEAPAADLTAETEDAAAGGGGGGEVSGTIEIDGSSTVGPLTDAIAEEYAQAQPDVTVNLGISGTGGGFERFCGTGDTQISNASRPISEDEVALCEENGIAFTEVRVGTDALTMVTNPQTEFVTCLTTQQVGTIFGPDAAATWDQVDPGFPAEPITVFAPGADSGTYDFMVEDVLDIEETRQDYNASEDDNIIAQGIAGTPGSWGFFGYAYFQESGDQLKALEFDGGDGCVAPSVETAQDDSYGLTRPLFIYVRNDALAEPHVADFVTFYLDTVGEVIESVGYIPAPEDTITESTQAVDQAIAEAGA